VAALLKQNDFSGLKNYFTERVSDLVKNIQKYEILKPATDLAAAEVSNRHVSDFIDKTLKEAFANAEKSETSDSRKSRTTLDPDEILKKSGFGSKKATSKAEEFKPETDELIEETYDEKLSDQEVQELINKAKVAHKEQELLFKYTRKFAEHNSKWGDPEGLFESAAKNVDEAYIHAKEATKALMFLGEKKFAEYFPDTYSGLSFASESVSAKVVDIVKSVDNKLQEKFGEKYTNLKDSAYKYGSAFSNEIDKNAPEIAKDAFNAASLGAFSKGASFFSQGFGKLVDGNVFRFDKIEVAVDAKLDFTTFTGTELNKIPGEKRGLVFMEESPRGKQAAIDFHAGTSGAMSDVESKKFIVPALRYDNENPRGMSYIKFDGFEVGPDGKVLIIDAKRNLLFTHDNAMDGVKDTLKRVERALLQNPEYKVVYEFPSNDITAKAQEFLIQTKKQAVISVRTRGK
jgi:hypothetical protein